MQLIRLTESTALNNAWIVGLLVACALIAAWLAVVLSSFVLRQLARSLRIPAFQSFTDGYMRRARLVGVITSFVLVLAGTGILADALLQQEDLQLAVDELLEQITGDTLTATARSAGVVLLFLLAFSLLRFSCEWAIARLRARLRPGELPERQHIFLERIFVHLPSFLNLALAYALLQLTADTFRLPAALAWLLLTIVYVLLVITGGRALVMLAHFLSERVLARWELGSAGTKLEEYYAALRRLLPIIQRSIEAIVSVSVVTVLVRRFEALEPFAPYGALLIRIISMYLAASVVVEVARVLLARLLLASSSAAEDAQRRRITFVGLIQSIAKYIIYFIVSMMVLRDLGVDPTPILAGVGIVGLAIGLGSQKLVADLLNGLFLLFEDQILCGDYIKIGDTEGVVELMTLRLTRIRDRFGRLHIMRNGEIQNVINYSRGWTLTVVEMNVSYEDDLTKTLRVISEVSAGLPALMPAQVLDTPVIKGIETIGESALVVRIETKVAPGTHHEVKRALHRLLVDGFHANGLEIPYPKAVIALDPKAAGSAAHAPPTPPAPAAHTPPMPPASAPPIPPARP